MKVYKCDGCGVIIKNPHKMRMKEFNIFFAPDEYGVCEYDGKQKIKIDLCPECFHSLREIAAEKAMEGVEK